MNFEGVYTKQDLRRFGDEYEIDIGDRVISGKSPGPLLQMANQIARGRAKPPHFLEAWKDGVRLAGEHNFKIAADSVEAATAKYQLAPNFEAVTESLGVASDGQRRFLIALYQFYNDQIINEYCQKNDIDLPTMSELARLDDGHLSVLTRLLNY